MNHFAGKTGRVVTVDESRRATNLDKYTVRFGDCHDRVFWEFQMVRTGLWEAWNEESNRTVA